MIIFHKTVMIGRDRAKKLHKMLVRLDARLDTINKRKIATQELISALPPGNPTKLSRLQHRIYLIDQEIEEIYLFIDRINDQLNNLNYKIKDTQFLPNDRSNNYIYKIYYYTNIVPYTYAPFYPIRIQK